MAERNSAVKFKIKFVVLLLFYAFFASGGAWGNCTCYGEVCGANEFCKRVVDGYDHGHPEYSYECVACPNGGVPTSSCSGCEEASNEDQCGDDQHLENNTCQPNTRRCNAFSHRIETDCWNSDSSLSCSVTSSANAVWNGTGWNVSQCSCSGEQNVSALKCNVHYVLRPLNTEISSVDTKITYSSCVSNGGVEQYYCSSCLSGTCPIEIVYNYSGGRCWSGGDDGYYSVCSCSEVQANYYSTGFGVPSDFNGDASSCTVPCETGLTTNGATGATSSAQCVPDGRVEYQDSTGRFTLGNDLCTP